MTHDHGTAILGAGPTGLEAALAAADAGLEFTLYEAGDGVADSVRRWGHVRLFTSWDLNVSPRMRSHLAAAGLEPPTGGECPTGNELRAKVFEPLAALPEIAPHLRLSTRVVSVGREGLLKHEEIGTDDRAERPFRLLLRDAAGNETVAHAARVIDTTGTYSHPNALGDGGIPAPGEAAVDGLVERFIPDVAGRPDEWADRTVLLVGSGHSAQTAARDLAELAERRPRTRVIWAMRRPEPRWPVDPDDPLPERSELMRRAEAIARGPAPGFEIVPGVAVEAVRERDGHLEVDLRDGAGEIRTVAVDRILSLTGYVGDPGLYRQLQFHECYATSGPMKLSAALLGAGSSDCLDQVSHGADTLVNPEPGFFVLGAKSYGRNSSFLMRLGWEQVDDVFGLWEAGA